MTAAVQVNMVVPERDVAEQACLRECRRVGQLLANRGADHVAMRDILQACAALHLADKKQREKDEGRRGGR